MIFSIILFGIKQLQIMGEDILSYSLTVMFRVHRSHIILQE